MPPSERPARVRPVGESGWPITVKRDVAQDAFDVTYIAARDRLYRLTARTLSFKIGRCREEHFRSLSSRRMYRGAERIETLAWVYEHCDADRLEWTLIDLAKRWPEDCGRHCVNRKRGGGPVSVSIGHVVYVVLIETLDGPSFVRKAS